MSCLINEKSPSNTYDDKKLFSGKILLTPMPLKLTLSLNLIREDCMH